MPEYYIKKLTKQELGLRADGSIARGRYFYISKQHADFFPHLSETVKNDNVLIPIIPPFTTNKIYCNFVYHNDKLNTDEGTRDEFRLYLNRSIDPDYYFQLNDVVVFEKIETSGVMPLYLLYRFQTIDALYSELIKIIATSPIKGGHAVVHGILPGLTTREINAEEISVIIPREVEQEIIEQQRETLDVEDEGIEDTRGASLFNAVSFRDFVLHAYGYRCAVTGEVIAYRKLNNLEAAHIQPRAHVGTFLPCNGIALSRDMHWAFDKGMFTISDDYTIVVHPEIQSSSLGQYHGQKIIVPIDAYFQPERKFLQHHATNVFGLFLYSGSIRAL